MPWKFAYHVYFLVGATKTWRGVVFLFYKYFGFNFWITLWFELQVLKRPTALLMTYICAELGPNAVVEYFNNAACPAR
jgi:hypothetical protein